MDEILKIAILLFDNFTPLDVIGPYEILSKLSGSKVYMTAIEPGLYSDGKGLRISAEYSLKEIESPDIMVIPGGFGIDATLGNKTVTDWIINAHKTTKWTVSVCSGSLLLAAAGLLDGREATTHWNRKKQLSSYGAIIKNERYIRDGKIITSAGVSAGIDMSLFLISLIVNDDFAKAVQLAIEYDPKPPFDSGSPDKCPAELIEKIRKSNK
jgi:transcriptional regulator GlxA family with amidase domain